MEKNVIIFGQNGMLGRDLIELFSYESSIVKTYSCDITDYKELKNVFTGSKGCITNVINCTAYTDIDSAEDNQEKVFKINNEAVKYLSTLCLENEIHLTHISCYHVLEGLKTLPYLEQDESYPLSVLGKSKLAGEGHVRAMGNKGLVIRTGWLYGKYGKNFIDTALNKLKNGTEVKVVDDQIGTPTYTVDLANVIIQLSLYCKSGLFNVSNSGSCTWYEFVKFAASLLDYKTDKLKNIKTDDLDLKIQRPKYSVLSLKRLEQTIPEKIRKWQDALYQYLIETKRIE